MLLTLERAWNAQDGVQGGKAAQPHKLPTTSLVNASTTAFVCRGILMSNYWEIRAITGEELEERNP